MSIAPQQAPSWPPPAPRPPRRWPAIAAAAGSGALVAAVITTLVTLAVTPTTPATPSAASPKTVTVTASPPAPPTPLTVSDADAQTCHAWGTADRLVTAGAVKLNTLPDDVQPTDSAIESDPVFSAAVIGAADLFDQAATVFDAQIAPGTSPTLAQTADTTASSLRTMAQAYRTFDPIVGNSIAVFQASQKALDWLCE
ncbi:MAG: hypothetical protein K0U84_20380 [Actinomycetia bacterium]|nr:hypothetical protein [Actinomycetes bacterium]